MADRGLTGILLVGGASARFGSPKALACLDGRTLAEIGWDALSFCDERIAVGKAADGLELPFALVDDGTPVRAPIAGVVAGLRAARNELCVILPVDTPRVGQATLRRLAEACPDAAVPQTGPLPGAYRKRALPVLERCLGEGRLALREAIRDLDTIVVPIAPGELANVNTPEELAVL